MLSKSKKVHWPTEKETVADSGKDLSEDRCEATDEDDSDFWSDSDEEPESDGDDYSDEDDSEDDAEDDHGCKNVRVNRAQIQILNTMLEEHDRQKDPGSYCSGEHEDVEHGLDMCGVFADEETGEAMIAGAAYEIAKHLYEFGLSPRKTLKRYITFGKKCEWGSWSKEKSVAARKLKPWFRERAWYSTEH
ncbi:hypothetical protein CKAH01_18338 [Colletotrichum kahawae]|uniref:Uncharacterized protein n=1 Tax=Colletotrichum kahawae TaxID=34407 RepID=A0AAD9Y8E2_COLKA|nr:hypothetical protein CKAH01_18338 [Colletotrichum kahawae]